MRKRLRISVLLAALGLAAFAASAAAVAWLPIYANDMSTNGLRGSLAQVGKGNCARSGVSETFRVKVGKKTSSCSYFTTVATQDGASVQVIVSGKLLSATPSSLRSGTFVGVSVRVGDGGAYQLQAYPGKRSFRVVRLEPPKSKELVIAAHKNNAIKGVDQGNKMRLELVKLSGTSCRINAVVNGKSLVSTVDDGCPTISGQLTTFSIGSTKNATGAAASFDNLQVAVPKP